MKFPESKVAHRWLDGLTGIEIGGSAHNNFGINPPSLNIDCEEDNLHKQEEVKLCGERLKIDIIADGDDLPFDANSYDYVLNSHVIEHMCNPIAAIIEWARVVKHNGLIYFVVPIIADAPDDKHRKPTPLSHCIEDYRTHQTIKTHDHKEARGPRGHYHMWDLPGFLALIKKSSDLCSFCWLKIEETHERDDRCGNGFIVVVRVIKED